MNAFAFLLSMTGLFFLFCFLPLWRHFAVCDQTTALPCCTTSRCHLECHSADGQRKPVLLALHFLAQNYLWGKGKDLVLLPEGGSLPRGQTSQGKGCPIKQGNTQSHPHLQLLLPLADFPQGLHLAAVHWEGQAGMAAQLMQCLLVGQPCRVIGFSPNRGWRKESLGMVQDNTKLHKLWAGPGEATGKNPTNSNTTMTCLWPWPFIHQAPKNIFLQ